ncbi:hypothetical protein ACFO5R_05865 [Halosolutus amylolyticus]|uniref:Uncharacterized protein n=1 Tax=Halosolutus amylolyticus TaxID=2932267 RepID=A0ABD5PLV3_9EURY|nr:hypothetical protein [Halosolutus amylolyticus]
MATEWTFTRPAHGPTPIDRPADRVSAATASGRTATAGGDE